MQQPVETVQTLGALADLHVADFQEGAHVWVQSLDQAFHLAKAGGVTPDQITAVAPHRGAPIAGAPNAVWLRGAVPSEYWAAQTSWFLSPSRGNDENRGTTADAPLRTHAELMR